MSLYSFVGPHNSVIKIRYSTIVNLDHFDRTALDFVCSNLSEASNIIGNGVSVYGILANGAQDPPTTLSFFIDSVQVSGFNWVSPPNVPGMDYNQQFFTTNGLTPEPHTLVIQNGPTSQSFVLLDYITYTQVTRRRPGTGSGTANRTGTTGAGTVKGSETGSGIENGTGNTMGTGSGGTTINEGRSEWLHKATGSGSNADGALIITTTTEVGAASAVGATTTSIIQSNGSPNPAGSSSTSKIAIIGTAILGVIIIAGCAVFFPLRKRRQELQAAQAPVPFPLYSDTPIGQIIPQPSALKVLTTYDRKGPESVISDPSLQVPMNAAASSVFLRPDMQSPVALLFTLVRDSPFTLDLHSEGLMAENQILREALIRRARLDSWAELPPYPATSNHVLLYSEAHPPDPGFER
ncbi:hypothetical protein C8J56DRAFT_1086304 [Mycena floridula]|nr:hypothetical protein C8J56DRAFT_1086304 [Mycena floridula]